MVLHVGVLAFSLKDIAWDGLLSTIHHVRIIQCLHDSRIIYISDRVHGVIRSCYLRDSCRVRLMPEVGVEISLVSSIDRRRVLFLLVVEALARIHQFLSPIMRTQVLLLSIIACHRYSTVLIMSIEDGLTQIYNVLHLDRCIMSDLGWAAGSLVVSMVRVLTPGYLSGWVLNAYHLTHCSSSCLDIATNWPSCWSFLWSVYCNSAPLIIDRCRREAALASWLHTSLSAGRVRCSARDDCAPCLWCSVHLWVVGFQVRVVSTWIAFMRWLVILWSSTIDPLRRLRLCWYCLWIRVKEA